MLNQLFSDILPDEPVNLANSAKLVVAGADLFQHVGLHHQLTVKMDATVKKQTSQDGSLWCCMHCQIRIIDKQYVLLWLY